MRADCIAAASSAVNMASSLSRLLGVSALKNARISLRILGNSPVNAVTQCRANVTTSSGAILPKPKKTPFGLIRIALVVVPFLYLGTQISKNFAALLEEHDIFVPEDDDDDD